MRWIHSIDAFPITSIAMKKPGQDTFGARLAAARMARGMTQEELGAAAGSSQRMVAHYENTPGAQPPADVLAALARALDVSADELLGLAPLSEHVNSATYRLRKRLRKVEDLPADDQKTVVKLVDALVTSRGIREGS
jgi:transcriptional regulator with XRE-family HTH domain